MSVIAIFATFAPCMRSLRRSGSTCCSRVFVMFAATDMELDETKQVRCCAHQTSSIFTQHGMAGRNQSVSRESQVEVGIQVGCSFCNDALSIDTKEGTKWHVVIACL